MKLKKKISVLLKIMFIKGRRTGFTLLETLLVLLITSFVVAVLIFGVNCFRNYSNNENRFFSTLGEAWNATILMTKEKQLETNVYFYPHDAVIFVSQGKDQKVVRRIKEPNSLSVVSYHDVKIGKDGYVKPQTIKWYSEKNKQMIYQKIQLGWGIYHLEK